MRNISKRKYAMITGLWVRSIFLVFGLFLMKGCIEPFIPETLAEDQQWVVEGFIEAGQGSNVAFVIITRSIPFLEEINRETLDQIFVRGAQVDVSDGAKTITLNELCLSDIPPELREAAAQILNIEIGDEVPNICVYVDLFDQLDRRVGGHYSLIVRLGETEIKATTTIPHFIPLENFRWTDPPGEPNDTLARLMVTVNDPPGENFYRYKTAAGDGPLIPPFVSVTDDVFFDGQEFEFPLQKAEPRDGDFSSDAFGLYTRGDTLTIKWMTLDEDHFHFWNTLDFSANSGGPFASYTRVRSNVNGALGVWGGYAVGYYHMRIPEK